MLPSMRAYVFRTRFANPHTSAPRDDAFAAMQFTG
jgi:hypothetical protein